MLFDEGMRQSDHLSTRETKYKQCVLVRGNQKQISWIPSQYAIKDKILTIDGEEGWIVFHFDDKEIDHEEQEYQRNEHKSYPPKPSEIPPTRRRETSSRWIYID